MRVCVEKFEDEEQKQELELEREQEQVKQVEEDYAVYLLDILKDVDSGNLKSVVEFLDREIENLRFIFDSCVNHGIEMEELVNETVFHVSDLAEIRELAVLLTEIRYSLLLDGFEAREKLKKILIERSAVGKRRLLALVL